MPRPNSYAVFCLKKKNARAEPIALDDEARKRLQVLDAVAVAQPAERDLARPAAAQLEGDLRELPAEGVVYAGPLLADAGDGCIEAEAGLEAGDHEVEGVGKRGGELLHAPSDPHAQPEVHQHVAAYPHEAGHEQGVRERLARGDARHEHEQRWAGAG